MRKTLRAGNRTNLTYPGGTVSQSYTYDANGNRLTQTDATGATSFTYDAPDRLTQAVYPAGYGTWTWTYDAVGNRTQQVAPGGTTGYTYDANNCLTQAANVVYSYDANGNLTSTSAGQTFTYNPFNQMTQATGPGGTVTHTFNGDGLKVRRVGPDGTTTRYYYDGIRPIWETDSGGAMTAQLDRDLFGNLLSRKEPAARRYYHFDGLGSTTALTNETGAVVATMFYDAWGLQRTSSGSGHGKYRYTGVELDTATGLYHMGARFYDPGLGRWLSEDAVQGRYFEPKSLNFYAYVANNPILNRDPTGMLEGENGPAGKRPFADVVLDWVKEFGWGTALDLVRKAWEAINEIIDALAQSGLYADLNLAAVVLGGLAGGVIHDKSNRAYAYFGVALGLSIGATYTMGVHGVTLGWNFAISGTFPNGFALQLGTALGCFASCNYREYGLGIGPGALLAIFYVSRIR